MQWPTFPEFVRLTLHDKDAYNQLVADYTPFSDLCFTTLHIWWNLDDRLSISLLNDNLIIDYQLPFDKKNSGFGLIGKHSVDSSMQTIFDHLQHKGQKPKLVHVPEFTIQTLKNPELLQIEEELDYHEYIVDSAALAHLESSDYARIRRKVNRFLREVEGRQLEIKSVDLSSLPVQDLLFHSVLSWQAKHPHANDLARTEDVAMKATLTHAATLETQNLCLYVDGVLQGMVLYHMSHDKQYYIINHLKVDYDIPFIFDYVTSQIALRAMEQHVPYLNMEMDLGIEGLRRHKQGLRPVTLLKKYKVTPAKP